MLSAKRQWCEHDGRDSQVWGGRFVPKSGLVGEPLFAPKAPVRPGRFQARVPPQAAPYDRARLALPGAPDLRPAQNGQDRGRRGIFLPHDARLYRRDVPAPGPSPFPVVAAPMPHSRQKTSSTPAGDRLRLDPPPLVARLCPAIRGEHLLRLCLNLLPRGRVIFYSSPVEGRAWGRSWVAWLN